MNEDIIVILKGLKTSFGLIFPHLSVPTVSLFLYVQSRNSESSYSSLDGSQNTPEKPSCQERAESLTSRDGRNTEQREEALRTYSSESRQLLKLSGTIPTHMEDPDK